MGSSLEAMRLALQAFESGRAADRAEARIDLRHGYRILKGKSLKNLKLAQVDDIHVADFIGASKLSTDVLAQIMAAKDAS